MNILKDEHEKMFISVYHSYVDEVYSFVFLRIGMNKALAEDITQDIFLNVYKGLMGFKGLCSERTWVYKIARNKINDYYRKQYTSKPELVELDDNMIAQLDDPSQNIQDINIRALERENIIACLNGLKEQYKIVLIMKYIDERSIKDISIIVRKSPKAIESVLQRAKNAFIKSYIKYDKGENL